MMTAPACTLTASDEHLVERVRAGEVGLYGVLMRRHNRRLHSMAVRILESEADAEDAVQEAHLHVLARLDQFAGRSSFLTWLTRIVMNEALMRRRSRKRSVTLDAPTTGNESNVVLMSSARDPEEEALQQELGRLLQSAVMALPEKYRIVFRMREVDEVDASTVARRLGVSHECVKTRLHRAKVMLQHRLRHRIGSLHSHRPARTGQRRGRLPKAA